MTRPRLEVAEVIRSCRDAFLRTVRCEPDVRAATCPRRPDGLPHGGPGRACPGVPGVRAPGGLLQLVRQPPLPQVPGHGRRAVAGDPGRRPARHTVLPRRVHAPRCPRPGRAAQPPCGVRPAHAGRREDPPRRWPRTRNTSGPRSACWRCCTPGARTWRCTRTSIASSPAAGSRSTGVVGSPAVTTSSCRSASSAVCSGASSSAGCVPPSSRGGSASRAGWRRWPGPERFHRLLDETVRTEWVVYAKPPWRQGRDGAEVPGAVHAQGGHQQPPPDRPRGRPGHLPLEGLRPRRSGGGP